MGKVKQNKPRSITSPTGLPSVKDLAKDSDIAVTETVIREINVAFEKIKSSDARDREYACAALGVYLGHKKTLQELLKQDAVRTVGCLLQDPKPKVILAASGVLRSMSEEGGFEACDQMIHHDILTFTNSLIQKTQEKWQTNSKPETFSLDSLINCIHLTQNLCESSNLALRSTQDDCIPAKLIYFLENSSLELVQAAAQCLYTISEDNEAVGDILRASASLEILERLLKAETTDNTLSLLTKVTVAGILSNVSEVRSVSDGPIFDTLLSAVQLDCHSELLDICNECSKLRRRPSKHPEEMEAEYGDSEEADSESDENDENGTEAISESKASDKKTKGEASFSGESQPSLDMTKPLDKVCNLMLAQKLAFEILSNITSSDDDARDWDDVEDDGSSIASDGMEADLMDDDMEPLQESESALTPFTNALLSHSFIPTLCSRISFLDDDLYNTLSSIDKTYQYRVKHVVERYNATLSSALLFFNNLLALVPQELLGDSDTVSNLFGQLITVSQTTHVCKNETLLEAVIYAARALVEKLSAHKKLPLADPVSCINSLKPVLVHPQLEIVVNTVRIMATVAQMCDVAQPHPTIKVVGECYMELLKSRSELWLIAETLDSLIDVFSEDEYNDFMLELNLLPFLQSALPEFRKLVKQRPRRDSHYLPLLSTVKINLPRFIKYKLSNASS